MRTLERLGDAFRIEGRTLHRVSDGVEVLETVGTRVSLWRQRGSSQRWVSVEIRTGSHAGLEVFVPVEALSGEADALELPQVGKVLVE